MFVMHYGISSSPGYQALAVSFAFESSFPFSSSSAAKYWRGLLQFLVLAVLIGQPKKKDHVTIWNCSHVHFYQVVFILTLSLRFSSHGLMSFWVVSFRSCCVWSPSCFSWMMLVSYSPAPNTSAQAPTDTFPSPLFPVTCDCMWHSSVWISYTYDLKSMEPKQLLSSVTTAFKHSVPRTEQLPEKEQVCSLKQM